MSDREIMNAKNYNNDLKVKTTLPSDRDMAHWMYQTLNLYAEEIFGEFGFANLTESQQIDVLKAMYADNMILK